MYIYAIYSSFHLPNSPIFLSRKFPWIFAVQWKIQPQMARYDEAKPLNVYHIY